MFLAPSPHLISGNIADAILGPRATPALVELGEPGDGTEQFLLDQIVTFTGNVFQGNLGRDIITEPPVATLIFNVLPKPSSSPWSAWRWPSLSASRWAWPLRCARTGWPDRIVSAISISFVALPAYVRRFLLLLIVFAVSLHALPAIGNGSASNPADYAQHRILPAVALALSWAGYFTRLDSAHRCSKRWARTTFAPRGRSDSPPRDPSRYAIKNAIIPTVAVLGVGFGTLISSAIFVEAIFTRSGLDARPERLAPSATTRIVRGGVLVIAVFVALGNLLSDISYRFLDPRIRVGTGR